MPILDVDFDGPLPDNRKRVLARRIADAGHVHLVYEAPARGRVAFGGTLRN